MGRKGPKMDETDKLIFRKATASQYSSVFYEKIKQNKRAHKSFLAALSVCGMRGLSLSETCDYITKLFPSYTRGKGLLPKTLASVISFYPEVELAYGFSMDVNEMLIHDRAFILAETTDDMGDIEKYHKMYSDGNSLYKKEESDKSSQPGVSDDTIKTLSKVFGALAGVEEPVDSDNDIDREEFAEEAVDGDGEE